eukprot:TRINITY_DN19167_c0_g1_i1.p1 TRINITY_DN19167_c0_g1~~TRINITY_DN19167_c0_g1_i1.p1  ORF type:complete len:348 (+),score=43.56 TRINITY_DN19167_c0_g1_i1:99-1142(+)
MGRDSSRKCSHCGHNGHNSRTCNEKGLKLFGVRILGEGDEEVMRKSLSMGNLASFAADQTSGDRGYLSDGPSPSERRGGRERKRGVPWTQEEHRTFLAGLEKLGKGDWRGISRNFVTTRTPTQVASHAQKYFLRQTTQNKKKRRSSLFDVVISEKINPTFSPPAMTSTAPETLSLMEEHDVLEEINLLHNDNYSMESPTGIAAQVAGLGLVASPTLPLIATCGEFPDYNGLDCLAQSSSSIKNQAAIKTSELYPTLSLIPNLELSDQANPIPHKIHKTSATGTPEFIYLPSSPSPRADPHCPFQATAADSPALENSDLELSIAPPSPLNTAKLSSRDSNFAGYIKVV